MKNLLSNKWRIVLLLIILVAAAIGGIFTGNKLSDMRANNEINRSVDETLGLAKRTGIISSLALNVKPASISAHSGTPAKVYLILTNKSNRPLILNKWLSPAPAAFGNNQLPIKQIVKKNGREVGYTGSVVLNPPLTDKDFFKLKAGESKSIGVDLLNGPHGGRWDMLSPGEYNVELWYETYFTGRYIGVNAWTGMTNHVVVKVKVL
ncbi:MAG: hypothetical protein ACYC27_20000 [Armatimonadota bacterium]